MFALRSSWKTGLRRALWLAGLALALTGSTLPLEDPQERVRLFTRAIEFDFASWTADALALKFGQWGLGISDYLPEEERGGLVLEYASLVDRASALEAGILELIADPTQAVPEGPAADRIADLAAVRSRQSALQPIVETILEEQVAQALSEAGLALGGMPFPPVSFRFTRLPLALITSPRSVIRLEADIQLDAGLTIEQQMALELRVEERLGVSALVVPVGGIGTYPTMVQETSALNWLAEVISHEWVHNYLTLRPLGMNYETSPDVRTMNETAASLLGVALGRRVVARHYPECLPPEPPSEAAEPVEPPAFDFQSEMRETREMADALLAAGEIEQAEAYMEARRQVFWDHGYRIRRLNQAYFAFHGAYADEPGGAAGEDPVGEMVRQLWALSPSPAAFLRRIAWLSDVDGLQAVLSELATTR
jgi:hypothetical protein